MNSKVHATTGISLCILDLYFFIIWYLKRVFLQGFCEMAKTGDKKKFTSIDISYPKNKSCTKHVVIFASSYYKQNYLKAIKHF
jgi:hypothetical protein